MRLSLAGCKNKHNWVSEDVSTVCPHCGEKWTSLQRIDSHKLVEKARPHFQIGAFKPYVEDGFTGSPVLVESRRQRNKLCKDNHLTYDKTSNMRPVVQTPAIDTIDFSDVKEAIESGKLNKELAGLPEEIKDASQLET